MGSVTIAELLSWQPGKLDGVSDKLNTRRRSLVDLQDEIDATKPPSDWRSDAGNAARTAHVKLRDDLNDMAAEIAKVVLGLDVASTNIATAKTDLQGQLDHARTLKCTVDHQTGNVTGPSEEDDPDGEVTQAQVNAIASAISDALTDAGNADADLATVMNAARTDTIDGGTGTLADADNLVVELAGVTRDEEFYKETLGQRSTQEQIDWVNQHNGDLPPAAAAALNAATQQHFADEVANHIQDPDSIDRSTVNVLTFLSGQQVFASDLNSQVSPDQFSDAISRMSNDTFPPTSNTPLDQATRAKLYQDFLNGAGATLATYSKTPGVDGDALSERWFDAITDDSRPANAAALTLMIKHGGETTSFDPRFLSSLTDKTYNWEQDHDGNPVWGPLNERQGDYGIKDPRDIDFGNPDDPYDDRAGYSTPYDGLANLLGAMKNTPEASEQFFDDPDTVEYHGQHVNEKLHYLLAERRWPTDDGDGLGTALEGATLHDRDGGDPNYTTPGEKSATLASQMVYIMGHEVGEGDSWRPGDEGWQVPEGMTDSVGKILAGYTPDTYRISLADGDAGDGQWVWGDSSGEKPGLPGQPVGLVGSQDDLSKVLQSIGSGDDKTGLQHVTTAALQYHNELNGDLLDRAVMPDGSRPQTLADLDHALVMDPDHPGDLSAARALSSEMDDEASNSGKLLSNVMQNGFLGGKADEAASQEERDAIAKAFGVATELVPTPQGRVAGFLTDQALGQVGDALGNQPDSLASQWASNSDEAIKNSLHQQSYNNLLQHGYLDPGKPGGLPEGAVVTDPRTGAQIIDPRLYNGGDGVDPDVRSAYQSWLASDAPSGLGQSSINAYASNLPHFDD